MSLVFIILVNICGPFDSRYLLFMINIYNLNIANYVNNIYIFLAQVYWRILRQKNLKIYVDSFVIILINLLV